MHSLNQFGPTSRLMATLCFSTVTSSSKAIGLVNAFHCTWCKSHEFGLPVRNDATLQIFGTVFFSPDSVTYAIRIF